MTSCAQEKPAGLIVQDTSGSTPVLARLWDAPILVALGPPGWNQMLHRQGKEIKPHSKARKARFLAAVHNYGLTADS